MLASLDRINSYGRRRKRRGAFIHPVAEKLRFPEIYIQYLDHQVFVCKDTKYRRTLQYSDRAFIFVNAMSSSDRS
jgi:hypothetical protein